MVPPPAFYLGWEPPARAQTFGGGDVDRPRCQPRRLRDAPQHLAPTLRQDPDHRAWHRQHPLKPTAPETAFQAARRGLSEASGCAFPAAWLPRTPGAIVQGRRAPTAWLRPPTGGTGPGHPARDTGCRAHPLGSVICKRKNSLPGPRLCGG